MIIYKIINKINKKVYIGQTIRSVKERFAEHCKPSSECVALKNAIKKYGKENFKLVILYKCKTLKQLNFKEQFFIKKYKSADKKFGYNCNFGGENKFHTQETKNKIRLAHLGKKRKPFTENHKIKLSLASKLRKGEKRSLSARINYSIASGAKLFDVFEKNTNKKVGTWLSQALCAEQLSIHSSKISACLLGKRNSHKGYIFRYVGEQNVTSV